MSEGSSELQQSEKAADSFIEFGVMRVNNNNNYIQLEMEPDKKQKLEVFISVKQKNLDILEKEVFQRSTPGSPLYGQWLTRDEVEAIKSNPEGGSIVSKWLTDNHVDITWSSGNHDYMKACATIEHWESLLHTKFLMWQNIKNNELIPRALTCSIPKRLDKYIHALTNVVDFPVEVSK